MQTDYTEFAFYTVVYTVSNVSLVFYRIDMITKSVRFLYQFLTSGIHFLYRRVYIKFEIHLHGVKHFTLYINYDMMKNR